MRNEPLVSAIIIFLNGEKFIREAIESVFAQTYDNWELLLVDDGSTDASTHIALRYAEQYPGKVRYLEHEGHKNQGMSATRNLGLHQAKGEYIAFLDHDDVWLPNKLKDQVTILEALPEAGMMYGRTRYWHSWTGRPEDRERDSFTHLGIQPNTLVKPPHLVTLFLRDDRTIVSTCSVLIRREIAERVGGFDETFRDQFEDMVFWTKVYLETPVFVAEGCWDCYRQHPDNSTTNAIRTGHWHPNRPSPSRALFLNRVEQYVLTKGITDTELLEALRIELFPYRHPEERTPSQKYNDVCWAAGPVLLRGEDARPLLRALGNVCNTGLDGHSVAEWIFESVPLSTRRTPSSVWVELWPRLKQRIEEFLVTLEEQAQATGLARQALRVLELMIQNKLWLRVTGGNIANLVLPPNDLDVVRIAIKKAETKTSFDIQLNMPRFKVKANHQYSINFQARADNPRSIALGFAKAHEPWDGLGFYKKIELTSEWCSFHEDFTATSNDENARIHFDVGESSISVDLSSVSLCGLEDGKTIEPDLPAILHDKQEQDKASLEKLPEYGQGEKIGGTGINISGCNILRRTAQLFRRWFERKSLILMYHRVAEVSTDPWSLCVTPQHFAEHLEILKKHFRPIQLQQLIKALLNGKVPRRSVVVTFDDGYADNLLNARPLLEYHNVPATVFLSTGYIGQGREFWWDELDRLLLQPGTLPETLYLCINGSHHQWSLGESAHYGEDAFWRHRYWRAMEDPPGPRHLIYFSLWQLLQPLQESERRKILNELLSWASAKPEGRPAYRILTQQEVVALVRGGLVEVGAHTVTHPALSTLPTALQRDEIQQSKTSLEKILGRPITSFAYPYGDYTAETVPNVREAGFSCACSTLPGVVWQDTERFQLPRVQIEDWDGQEFSRKLSMWFDSKNEDKLS
jgi:glycosyltransferase involved in cell wall biosynthesis/peptidoglycan/xylan/chitin deacetylase (PgdA/CDA1 family)